MTIGQEPQHESTDSAGLPRRPELMPDPLAESTPRHQERCGGQTQGKGPKSLQQAKASAFFFCIKT